MRPGLSFRTIAVTGVTLALTGGGIAVGTGALHTSLSDSTINAASAANWSKASAKAEPGAQSGNSDGADGPGRLGRVPQLRHRHGPGQARRPPPSPPSREEQRYADGHRHASRDAHGQQHASRDA